MTLPHLRLKTTAYRLLAQRNARTRAAALAAAGAYAARTRASAAKSSAGGNKKTVSSGV